MNKVSNNIYNTHMYKFVAFDLFKMFDSVFFLITKNKTKNKFKDYELI